MTMTLDTTELAVILRKGCNVHIEYIDGRHYVEVSLINKHGNEVIFSSNSPSLEGAVRHVYGKINDLLSAQETEQEAAPVFERFAELFRG